MNIRLKRTPGLYVVGFMASGKSTVGRHLAKELGWSFFDIDDEIEAAENTSIASIFDSRGEEEFRRIEAQIIAQHVRWIERGRPAVLAFGKRRLRADSESRSAAGERHGDLAGLPARRSEASCGAGASHRPLARDTERFAALFHARRENYAAADVHIAIESDDPDITVKTILAHPLLK